MHWTYSTRWFTGVDSVLEVQLRVNNLDYKVRVYTLSIIFYFCVNYSSWYKFYYPVDISTTVIFLFPCRAISRDITRALGLRGILVTRMCFN